MTPDRLGHETESAVETLLLKKNGERKTVSDVFEIVVAMNHDRRTDNLRLLSEIAKNSDLLEAHARDYVHMDSAELAGFMAPFAKRHDERDAIVDVIEKDLQKVQAHCEELHGRAPRRSGDPDTEDWGNSFGDEELGDIRRFWRVGKWFVVAVAAPLLVALGNELSRWLT
jgi:hypothetical protein